MIGAGRRIFWMFDIPTSKIDNPTLKLITNDTVIEKHMKRFKTFFFNHEN